MWDLYYRIRYYVHDVWQGLKPHRLWLVVVTMVVISQLGLNASSGELKPVTELDWIDMFGEGATALFILVWLLIVLSIRSPGRVTTLFALGLLGIFISNFQDLIDELYQLSDGVVWDSWLESMPVGLLILTAALWFWRTEQHHIQSFMERRGVVSRISQEPTTWDSGLALPEYDAFIAKVDPNCDDQILMMVQLDNFHDVTYQRGRSESDQLANSFVELLLLHLRAQDMMCRYTPGCFVILLTQVDNVSVLRLQQSIGWLLASYCDRVYRDQYALSVSFGISNCGDSLSSDSLTKETSEHWVERARQNLMPFNDSFTHACEPLGC